LPGTLAVDSRKADRSSSAGRDEPPSNRTIVSTIATLADWFNLQVIAEGVEVRTEREVPRTLRSSQFQGNLAVNE